jgi:hypothetical protein
METNEFGLVEKIMDFNPATGAYSAPFQTFHVRYKLPLHVVKAAAGVDFHNPFVKSVCVYDHTGKVHLYLKRDAEGHCIMRIENKVKIP